MYSMLDVEGSHVNGQKFLKVNLQMSVSPSAE